MQLGLLGFDSKQWVKIWFLYWHSQAFIPTVHPEQWVKSLITCFKVRIFLVRADHFYYSIKMQKRKNIISINYNQFFCDHGLKTPQKTWIFPRSTRVQFFSIPVNLLQFLRLFRDSKSLLPLCESPDWLTDVDWRVLCWANNLLHDSALFHAAKIILYDSFLRLGTNRCLSGGIGRQMRFCLCFLLMRRSLILKKPLAPFAAMQS